jgi:hypothetical protein
MGIRRPDVGLVPGAHKKKGRLRCHKRPKSREETPKEGSDSGSATAYPTDKVIAIGGSIERKGHGPIRRFVALAHKTDHFRTRRRPSLPAHYVEHGIVLDLDATVPASSAHHDHWQRSYGIRCA